MSTTVVHVPDNYVRLVGYVYSPSVWIGMCRLVHVALADLPVKIRCHVVFLEDLLRLRQRFLVVFFFK